MMPKIRILWINDPEKWDYAMRRTIFDLDVLRTFSTGMELGNFAKAAERLGRSTSAVSAQLKRLEEQAGTPIFRKAGRGAIFPPRPRLLRDQ
jgi:DNA-binding transcriptional LysR family regulator